MTTQQHNKLVEILKKVPAALMRAELQRRRQPAEDARRQRLQQRKAEPKQKPAPLYTSADVINAVARVWGIDTLPITNTKAHPKKLYHARLAVVSLLRTQAGFTNAMIRQFYKATEGTVISWHRRHRINISENANYTIKYIAALSNLTNQH